MIENRNRVEWDNESTHERMRLEIYIGNGAPEPAILLEAYGSQSGQARLSLDRESWKAIVGLVDAAEGRLREIPIGKTMDEIERERRKDEEGRGTARVLALVADAFIRYLQAEPHCCNPTAKAKRPRHRKVTKG